jgi:hypothetical protein
MGFAEQLGLRARPGDDGTAKRATSAKAGTASAKPVPLALTRAKTVSVVGAELSSLRKAMALLTDRMTALETFASISRPMKPDDHAKPWEAEGVSRRTWYRRRKDRP